MIDVAGADNATAMVF
ncbi:hypothetical protein ACIRP3_42055 [Streptomyces sp. NPDC101209]